jgi:signal transduction histidine kinase
MSRKILLIDDQLDYARIVNDLLKQNGYELLLANNGSLGCKIAKSQRLDVIITDWEMPGWSGIDVIRTLKKDPSTKDIPIIMATGVMTTSENLSIALEAGAMDYIRKPIDEIELIARIKTASRMHDSIKTIRYQNDLLQSSNHIKAKLLSIVAHDLRTPLTSLKGSLELARHNGIDNLGREFFQELLDLLESELYSVVDLVENLLSWSLSQQSTLQLRLTTFSVKSVAQQMVQSLQHIAKKREVHLDATIDNHLSLTTDLDMFNFVLRNLLSNALKFTESGGQIKLSIHQDQEPSHAIISVQDSGIGIKAEEQKTLFALEENILERQSAISDAAKLGTGLGLKVTSDFLKMMNGTIWVESIYGQGSTFYIRLPLHIRQDN